MDPQMMIVAIVAIGCLTGLIKTWVNRKEKRGGIEEERFEQLAHSFEEFRNEMRERVQNLETIASEMEDEDLYHQIEESNDPGRLTNDLKQKNRVQS